MTALAWLIPCALLLGLAGWIAFLWSLHSGHSRILTALRGGPCGMTTPIAHR